VAIKNVVIPWFSGGALVLGYAAFAWLRGRRGGRRADVPDAAVASPSDVAPLAEGLEHVPEELALNSEGLEHVPEELALDSEAEPAPESSERPRSVHRDGASHHAGALFLGRVSAAFSPFENRNSVPR
jgi:hypothetical protein